MLRIVAPEAPGVHLPLEIGRSASEQRLQRNAEFDVPSALFRKRLSTDQANKVWIGLEEFEPSGQNMVDLVPAVSVTARYRRFDSLVPLGQRLLEHLAVHRLLGREVMQQALAPDADLSGDEVERCAVEAAFGEETLRSDDDRILRGQPTHGREP